MRYYSGDPRWITARYPGSCARCEAPITKGDRAFYYPKGKSLYCDADGCGHACDRDFHALAADEDFYNSAY